MLNNKKVRHVNTQSQLNHLTPGAAKLQFGNITSEFH